MFSQKEKLNHIRRVRQKDLSLEELRRARNVYLRAYKDLSEVCDRYHLDLMLAGGSCLGCIRHGGFIPWDDDFDVNMPREDFEKLKDVFDKELGEKYILCCPNYKKNAKNRFAKILIKGTKWIEFGMSINDPDGLMKIDLFTMENIPNNIFFRLLKGAYCDMLMLIASGVSSLSEYKRLKRSHDEMVWVYGKLTFKQRICGKLFSFHDEQYWYDKLDFAIQYRHKTGLVGFPTGRKHYFGEIHSADMILPLQSRQFEGAVVKVPGRTEVYLKKLYGERYMEVPPEEKREKHYLVEYEIP